MNKDGRRYESGKRGRVPTSPDPYVSQERPKEPALCTSCKTVYLKSHWVLDPEAYRKLQNDPKAHMITCPACQKVAAKHPEGIITLSGSYLWEHEEEIRRILDNEEHKALAKNPFERIMGEHREGDKLVIETTERKLAEHLGRVLHRSHQGDLDISWTGNPEICRVNWERML